MSDEKELSYWDVIIKVADTKTREVSFRTYTQAYASTVSESTVRRNIKEWVRQLNKAARNSVYSLEKMGQSGSLDSEITRLLSQGRVESANHTIRL